MGTYFLFGHLSSLPPDPNILLLSLITSYNTKGDINKLIDNDLR
jgi:hypothetical protein